MIAVAICALATAIDDEAPVLARTLGAGVYDVRLKLSQPLPTIVHRTSDVDEARTLGAALRARGHDVVVIDESRVPAPRVVRTFRFGESFEWDGGAAIAYANIVALVRAARAHKTETTTRVTERKLRPAAAIATGGLVLSKKVSRDEKRVSHDREELCFIFSREASPPLLLAERTTSYASLAQRGDALASSSRENFLRVVAELRTRAPTAPFDEKLLAHKSLEALEDVALRAQILAIFHANHRKGLHVEQK